jgi:hypothetical protein
MGAIKKLRENAGNYFLLKRINSLNRSKKLVNINSAGSVGIIFELSDEAVYYSVQNFMYKLQENNTRVKALGFTPQKSVVHHFLPVLSFDFFNSKQLNWLYIPTASTAKSFMDTEFDICLNIAPDNVFPLKYIAGLSIARLKVGAYSQASQAEKYGDLARIYDIMLLSDNHHNQITFLDNIYEYLTILNPKEDV